MRLFVLLLFLSLPLHASNVVHLTSLDWPPYSSKSLAGQGVSVEVARQAFKAMGYELKVDFFPWSRTVKLASDTNSKYSGYFPEYFSEEGANTFIFSEPMGTGPLGFMENSAKRITWNTLNDLARYRIGVVQDYVNTPDFDAKVADGSLKAIAVTSDKQNVLKVGTGRIDLAVIDSNVLSHMLNRDKSLAKVKSKVVMNNKLLVNKQLHIAFKRTPEGKKLAEIFNQGLKKIDVDAIMKTGLSQ